jgi:hypothetical protein
LAPRYFELIKQYGEQEPMASRASRVHLAQRRQELLSRVIEGHAQSAEGVRSQLERLNSHAAISPDVWANVTMNPDSLIQSGALNRLSWTVGVAATGTSLLPRDVHRYFAFANKFFALSILRTHLGRGLDADNPADVARNQYFEAIRRVFPVEIRFAWVSELISQCLAAAIHAERQAFHGLEFVTHDAIEQYFGNLRAMTSADSFATLISEIADAAGKAGPLEGAMSVASGQLRTRPIESLLLDRSIERYPFVRFDQGPAALGIREAAFHIEQSLFEMSLTKPGARGQLFEEVTGRALATLLPDEFIRAQGPLFAAPGNQRDPGEIDFAFMGPDLLLLGECKAHFVTDNADSVVNSFVDELGRATGQLRTRLSAIRDSGVPPNNLRPSGSGHMRLLGIGVPLQSYGAAVWDFELLSRIGAVDPQLAFIPLHQCLITASLMLDGRDLRRYFFLRHLAMRQRTRIYDESDLLRLHVVLGFSGDYRSGALNVIPQGSESIEGILPAFDVDADAALQAPRPGPARKAWRSRFVRMTRPVT